MHARRLAVLAGSLALGGNALAQERPSVEVEVRSVEPAQASVRLRHLLTDRRFIRAMESGFPLYLEYRVELRESKSLWDRTVSTFPLEYVVSYDPVREVYLVEDPDGSEEFPTEARLQRRLETVYIVPLQADRPGTFHFRAIVDARTLSDEDVDEVFDWLHGENGDSVPGRRPGLFTRTARRLLQRVAPLPRERFEGRSADFVIR